MNIIRVIIPFSKDAKKEQDLTSNLDSGITFGQTNQGRPLAQTDSS